MLQQAATLGARHITCKPNKIASRMSMRGGLWRIMPTLSSQPTRPSVSRLLLNTAQSLPLFADLAVQRSECCECSYNLGTFAIHRAVVDRRAKLIILSSIPALLSAGAAFSLPEARYDLDPNISNSHLRIVQAQHRSAS